MTRAIATALGLVLVLATTAVSEDSSSRPLGTWKRQLEDGSTWTLVAGPQRMELVAHMPGGPTIRIAAPQYDLSDEGILYGYARSMVWSQGPELKEQKGLFPFAMRIRIDGQTITISDFTMRNVNDKGAAGLMGVYDKQPDGPRTALPPTDSDRR